MRHLGGVNRVFTTVPRTPARGKPISFLYNYLIDASSLLP